MSLRSSLSLLISLIVLVTLIFGAGLSYLHALGKVDEEMQASIAVGARIAANAVDDPEEWTNPERRLVLLVADFHGDRHLRAKWMAPDGRLRMSSTPSAPSVDVPGWFQELIWRPERRVVVQLPLAFAVHGQFVLETDQSNEIGEVWEDSLNTLTILGVFSLLVLVSVHFVLGWALRPLDRLVGAFNDVSTAMTPPRVPEHGPRDLVKVYAGFNAMTDRLSRTEARNVRLNEQLSTVQEEERADLARDLHDEIGPFLFSADVDAAAIVGLIEAGRHDEVPERVGAVRESIRHMQQHVRDLLSRLRSAALVDVGLGDAVEHMVEFWRQRYPDVAFDVIIPDRSFGESYDATIYRVIQESLNNAIRHGRPDHVEVFVGGDEVEGVRAEVRNDGRGLQRRDGTTAGFGIAGMRERLVMLGGTLDVSDRTDGPGVQVCAWLPPVEGERGAISDVAGGLERHDETQAIKHIVDGERV